MIKFVILDVYPNKNHRLIKDTAGGYGTGNNFGNTFFSDLIDFWDSAGKIYKIINTQAA